MTSKRTPARRTGLGLIVALMLSISALSTASPATANPITIAKSGSYGFWGGSAGSNVCGKDWYSGYVRPVAPYVSRTPAYPNHTQTIRTTSHLDQWTGTSWAFYKSDGGQIRTLPPGTTWALFTPLTSFTVATGRYYRVVQFYEWRVNGILVGTGTNLFDQYEYTALGAWVGQTGAQASYCYIP